MMDDTVTSSFSVPYITLVNDRDKSENDPAHGKYEWGFRMNCSRNSSDNLGTLLDDIDSECVEKWQGVKLLSVDYYVVCTYLIIVVMFASELFVSSNIY